MEWVQVLAMIFGNAAFVIPLWLWNRSESRADMRYMDSKIEAHAKETQAIIQAIREEMKDFHGRLCSIEERGKK